MPVDVVAPPGARTSTSELLLEKHVTRSSRVVESVHETHGTVKFEKLQLQRITLEDDGSESIEDIYTAGAVLPAGKLKLVGAAAAPDSKRVLFLALQTRPR